MQKNKNLIPTIINCDTGIDDAVAIMMAVKSKKLDIKLITTDLGNVNAEQSAINTLNILDLIGAPNIPVVAGQGKCFKIERERVSVHGNDGLGGYKFNEHNRTPLLVDAVEEMYKTIMASEEKMTIICISPTTNIAKLVSLHKDCVEKIERIVIMVGSIEKVDDDEIPYPEFNCSGDPEACEEVFNSNVKIEIVPMEMGHTAYLDWQDVFKTKNTNFVGSVFEYIFRSYKDRHVKNGIATHDECAIVYVTNPEIFETKQVFAEVKYFETIGTGVLSMNFEKNPNVITCTKINISKFKKLYFKCLKSCK